MGLDFYVILFLISGQKKITKLINNADQNNTVVFYAKNCTVFLEIPSRNNMNCSHKYNIYSSRQANNLVHVSEDDVREIFLRSYQVILALFSISVMYLSYYFLVPSTLICI